MKRIKEFKDGTYLKYGRGRIDNWCVYLVDENGKATPPLDTHYFEELYHLANGYGKDKVYNDFVSIMTLQERILMNKFYRKLLI